MIRKNILVTFAFLTSLIVLPSVGLCADSSIVGLATDGSVYEVNKTNGTLTLKAQETITSFSLGGIVRRQNELFYVAAPSGSSENALYNVNLKSGAISHVDLDRSDDVKILFFNGKKLYGIFYVGSTGAVGVYQINPKSGVTKLALDLSSLSGEPVGGAFARHGQFFHTLLIPNDNRETRQLLTFRLKKGSAKVQNIATKDGTAVICDRLKRNKVKQNFICLASTSSTQVGAFTLTDKGKATYLSTLADVERLAGGHTMLSPDDKNYYAFVYAPGDSNSQRLIKLTAKGVVKSTATVSTLIVGARFGKEDEAP